MYEFSYLKKYNEVKILKNGVLVATRRNVFSVKDTDDLRMFAKEWFDYRGMSIPKKMDFKIVDD